MVSAVQVHVIRAGTVVRSRATYAAVSVAHHLMLAATMFAAISVQRASTESAVRKARHAAMRVALQGSPAQIQARAVVVLALQAPLPCSAAMKGVGLRLHAALQM